MEGGKQINPKISEGVSEQNDIGGGGDWGVVYNSMYKGCSIEKLWWREVAWVSYPSPSVYTTSLTTSR